MSSYWGGQLLNDPHDMEKFFSTDQTLGSLPTVREELQGERIGQMEVVRALLHRIPPREADFIELYYFNRLRQTSIAHLFCVSQPTVCYRLQRGAARLKFLISLPEYTKQELEDALLGSVSCPTDRRIMVRMVKTTCQSEVARELGVTQGFVRHRFLRTIERLKLVRGMEKFVDLFSKVAANPNILKNTSRSAWSEEVIHSIY